ncbi:MAG: glycosyl hydrolase [Gammaproteobacteria bacterium RIFCSPLOWO2_02_FULL_57_10]|nr:MAG: glycosyl hydrolase [Gammaproteobacteria bacterium RIFCSPLOWO2_02_FULL_57_10]
MTRHLILVGTRKGAWIVEGDANRSNWKIKGPMHLGAVISHYVADPRTVGYQLMSVGSGHLGPSVFISKDHGETWTEAATPPAFAPVGDSARSVDHVFWLTPGHASEPNVWYAGTSPQGLFKSRDGGNTWEEVKGFNHHPDCFTWRGGDKDGTPDGPKLHSIIVDHSDKTHLLVGMSGGGIFESFDEGATWKPLNKGVAMDFYPPKEDGSEYEFGHDPHCMVMHPVHSNRLYHQNHCGLYALDRDEGDRWTRIGDNMPKDVGDIGFPIVVHPRDPDTAWTFPMDGSGQWPRTAPGGKPAVFRTRDGGKSFERMAKGFPAEQGWWTVKRQCMAVDAEQSVGVYLGTTNGQLWGSFDEGATWQGIAMDLPQIYSVEVVTIK